MDRHWLYLGGRTSRGPCGGCFWLQQYSSYQNGNKQLHIIQQSDFAATLILQLQHDNNVHTSRRGVFSRGSGKAFLGFKIPVWAFWGARN